MRKMMFLFTVVWISAGGLSGCANSKAKIFGEDMPTMKAIHDMKFHATDGEALEKPQRKIEHGTDTPSEPSDFQWLPNPTLTMYVFKHLSPAGYPVPGYSTFFRLYERDSLAELGEREGWK